MQIRLRLLLNYGAAAPIRDWRERENLLEYTTLGRTGLRVSRLGLGGGGHSRLGLALGREQAEAERVVHEALALGVNFIDTAESYQTEAAIGSALRSSSVSRSDVVISTKAGVGWQGRRCSAADYVARIEACLKRLQTGYIDVFHIHGVLADEYAYAEAELLPAVMRMQAKGKVRFTGITEQFIEDPGHRMLSMALENDCWDVMMVGFNLLNPSARQRVLAHTQAKGIGTLCMFAVRRALSRRDSLNELMQHLALEGLVDAGAYNHEDPLDFLTGDAESIPDAAYRFCRYEPGMDVILSGTGSIEHLRANAVSLERPPLPEAALRRLEELFGNVDCVSGN